MDNSGKMPPGTQAGSWKVVTTAILVLSGIYVVVTPFAHMTSIKEGSFYLSLILFLLMWLSGKVRLEIRTPFLAFGTLFFLWSAFGLIFALNVENSIHDLYAHLLRYVLLYYLLLAFYDTPRRITLVFWLTLLSATVFSVWCVWYYYFYLGNPWDMRLATGAVVGMLVQTPLNIIGCVSVFGIASSLFLLQNKGSWGAKWAAMLPLPLLVLPLCLGRLRSGIIALVVVLLVGIRDTKARRIGGGVVLLLVLVFSSLVNRFTPQEIGRDIRIPMARLSMMVVADYPLTGIGFGMRTFSSNLDLERYRQQIGKSYNNNFAVGDPHNFLFDVAIRTGLVGLALFIGICAKFLAVCWRTLRVAADPFVANLSRTALAAGGGLATIGLFQPFFSNVINSLLCFTFYAATMAWWLNGGTEKKGAGAEQAIQGHPTQPAGTI